MRRAAAALAALLVLGLVTVGVPAAPVAAAGGGFPGPDDDFAHLPAACLAEDGAPISPCTVVQAGPRRPTVFLWGDSHAWMYLRAVRRLARRHDVTLVAMVRGSCPVSAPNPTPSGRPKSGCEQHNKQSLGLVRRTVRTGVRVHVVVGSWWSGYRRYRELGEREEQTGQPSGLTSFHLYMADLAVDRSLPMMRRLARLGVTADVIAQAGVVPDDARAPHCARGNAPYRCPLPRRVELRDEAANERFLARLASPFPRARTIDPSALYCGPRTCRAYVDRVPVLYDNFHLGDRLVAKTVPWFRPSFRDLGSRR